MTTEALQAYEVNIPLSIRCISIIKQVDRYYMHAQCDYCNLGHPDYENQSQRRAGIMHFNICDLSQSNVEYKAIKFGLVRS